MPSCVSGRGFKSLGSTAAAVLASCQNPLGAACLHAWAALMKVHSAAIIVQLYPALPALVHRRGAFWLQQPGDEITVTVVWLDCGPKGLLMHGTLYVPVSLLVQTLSDWPALPPCADSVTFAAWG